MRLSIITLALSCIVATHAWADADTDHPASNPFDPANWDQRLEAETTSNIWGSQAMDGGRISSHYHSLEIEYGIDTPRGPGPFIQVIGEQRWFDDNAEIMPDKAHYRCAEFFTPIPLADKWFLGVNASVEWGWENDAEMNNGQQISGKLSLIHAPYDGLYYGGALRLRESLEDGLELLPSVVLIWDMNDKWQTKVTGSKGLISYALQKSNNSEQRIGAFGNYHDREYRLSDNHLISPKGTLQTRAIQFGVEYDLVRGPLELSVQTGIIAWQSLEWQSPGGNIDLERNSDQPAPFAMLEVQWTF